MPKFGQFDSTIKGTAPITGWYDTDILNYPNIPQKENLILIDPETWDNRMPGPWGVLDGDIVAIPPPKPPVQSPKKLAMFRQDSVVTVKCESIPALDGTYSASTASQVTMTGIAVAINGGLGLPSGEDTFAYLDSDGEAHDWPAEQFVQLVKGVMVYNYRLSHDLDDALPDAVITIS